MAFTNYQSRKLKIIKNMVRVVTIIFFVYGVINYSETEFVLYFSEFMLAGLGMIVILTMNRWTTRQIEMFSLILCITLCSYLFFILHFEGLETTSHIWLTTIPITTYLITGMRWGLRLTSLSLLIIILLLGVKGYLNTPTMISTISLENVIDVLLPYLWVWVLTHIYEKANSDNQNILLDIATKDSLTNLHNRRAFYDVFNSNRQFPVSLMAVDLDWFKSINDTHGHDGGDFVLKHVANKLLKQEQNQRQVFRIGGEEFAILLPNSDLQQTVKFATQLLTEIRNEAIQYGDKTIRITASIGVAVTDIPCDLDTLMKEADKHLYKAKASGRDRVVY